MGEEWAKPLEHFMCDGPTYHFAHTRKITAELNMDIGVVNQSGGRLLRELSCCFGGYFQVLRRRESTQIERRSDVGSVMLINSLPVFLSKFRAYYCFAPNVWRKRDFTTDGCI